MENPDHVLTDDEMPRLVAAMHRQENGCKANMQQVMAGYEMFLIRDEAKEVNDGA